ncbi:MAG: hypothetical protein ACE14V_14675 [bacterium]
MDINTTNKNKLPYAIEKKEPEYYRKYLNGEITAEEYKNHAINDSLLTFPILIFRCGCDFIFCIREFIIILGKKVRLLIVNLTNTNKS